MYCNVGQLFCREVEKWFLELDVDVNGALPL